jgi:hypothetical protein
LKKWRDRRGRDRVDGGWWMGLMGDALVCLHVDVSFTDGSSRPTARK